MTGPEVMRAFEHWCPFCGRSGGCDCRDRAQCDLAGNVGHQQCGKHPCGCPAFLPLAHRCESVATPSECYPLNVGVSGQLGGQWYVRERMPGTRVWRAEEDGSFTLLEPRPIIACRVL